jgi:hypothetical protein
MPGMATDWQVTMDCASPAAMAAFWAEALGYVVEPPPSPYADWGEWCAAHDLPPEEAEAGASIVDPAGVRPRIYFQLVPERRTEKNRLHMDVTAGGPRDDPPDVRWARITAAAERLTAAGATVLRMDQWLGEPHHLVLEDPEGHQFCLH